MSQPPKPQALSREDFPEQAGWIDRLLRPINAFIGQTSAFLGGSLVDQGQVFLRDDTFTTGSAVADSFPRFFAVPRQPQAVLIGGIEDITAGATFTTAPSVTWTPSNDGKSFSVKIRHITGLTTSNKYRVTFLVLL